MEIFLISNFILAAGIVRSLNMVQKEVDNLNSNFSNTKKELEIKQTALDHIDKICKRFKDQIANQSQRQINKELQMIKLKNEIRVLHNQVEIYDSTIDKAVKHTETIQNRMLNRQERKQALLKLVEEIDAADDIDKKKLTEVKIEIETAQNQKQQAEKESGTKKEMLTECQSEVNQLSVELSQIHQCFYGEIISARTKNN